MAERRGPADLRADAARVLAAVSHKGHSSDRALARVAAGWPGPDGALLAEIVYGSLRWHQRLTAIVQAMTRKPAAKLQPELAALIVAGLYQLWKMRIPDHAAVAETVSAAPLLGHKRAKGFVNALLRRFQREADTLLAATTADPAAYYSHPAWFVEMVRSDWPNDWAAILNANNDRAPMWLRVNRALGSPERYKRELQALEPAREASEQAGLADALRLASPASVDALPGFDTGAVSVQDGAAQLAAEFIAAEAGQRVLDACAAPGGKSAHLLERHGETIDLTALDIDADRLARVAETLERIGCRATLIVADATDPKSWWDGRPFDRILVDAPCSASGVIRRHPDIKLLRRPQDIAALTAQQNALLKGLWPLLAPGGRLVYATCSVLQAENSGVVNDFLNSHSDALPLQQLPKDNIRALMSSGKPDRSRAPGAPGFQVLPGTAGLDGFYYACILKQP